MWTGSEETVKEIHDRGHDVELHWHPLLKNKDYFHSESIPELSLYEQITMLNKGTQFIEGITGRRPIAFRAGALRINDSTLDALNECGFYLIPVMCITMIIMSFQIIRL